MTDVAAVIAFAVLMMPAALGEESGPAVVVTISPSDLVEFESQSRRVRELIRNAISLTRKKLDYRFGSNSPRNGGMDCSGTVQHALGMAGIQSPRMAHTIYLWARKSGNLRKVPAGVQRHGHEALSHLKPGDLVFWEGTYLTGKRNPPISHVMIYLGTLRSDGKPVMFGASSGRRFRGKKIHGVSVFDFSLPKPGSSSKLIGYGPVPGAKP